MTVEQLINTLKNAPDQQAEVWSIDSKGDPQYFSKLLIRSDGDILLVSEDDYQTYTSYKNLKEI